MTLQYYITLVTWLPYFNPNNMGTAAPTSHSTIIHILQELT